MFDLDTKFTVVEDDLEKMNVYLELAPSANFLLESMRFGIVRKPDDLMHPIFEEVLHRMPKFLEPIPGLKQTAMQFVSYEYLSTARANAEWPADEVGWRYVITAEGNLGVACRPDAGTEPSVIEAFITWEAVEFDGR